MRVKSVTPKDQPSTSEPRKCPVCSDKSDGIHFGADTCRACAAFFRRCVVLKKNYACREGKDSCSTNSAQRNVCRKCRLRKCFDVGMLVEGVQNNRDPIVPKTLDREPLSACTPSIYSTECKTLSACTSIAKSVGPSSEFERMEFLTSIKNNYVSLCTIRRATEISMHTDCVRKAFLEDGKMPTEFFATFSKVKKTHRAHMPAYISFMMNTFPEIKELTEEERQTIIKHCVLVFWTLDAAYKTYKNVKPEEITEKIFLSETLYSVQGKLVEFLDDAPIPWEEFLVMMKPYGQNRFDRSKEIRDLKLDEIEYCALLAATLWSENMLHVTDAIIELGTSIRSRVNKELHWWYLSIGNSNYAERMCSMLFLVNSSLISIQKEKEATEIVNLLDWFHDDKFMYDLIKYENGFSEASADLFMLATGSFSNDSPGVSVQKKCLICSDVSDGLHFNVDSCRACAAFFRRSVMLKKRYVCRQGTNNCPVGTAVRCICRKCRLRRCLDAGMSPESVQGTRDPIVPKSTDTEPLSAFDQSIYSSEVEVLSASKTKPNKTPNFEHENIVSTTDELKGFAFLISIQDNYKNFSAVRKALELTVNADSMREIFWTEGRMPEEILATHKKVLQVHRCHMPANIEFISTAFPQFETLNVEERRIVVKHCVLVFWTLDSAYRTYKRVPADQIGAKLIMSETMYCENGKWEEFFQDAPKTSYSAEEFLMLMRPYGQARVKLSKDMAEMQLQDIEYWALLTLTMWSENMFLATESIIRIAKEMRQLVTKELHAWYISIGNKNYAERLCTILYMINNAMTTVDKMKESVQLVNLIDMFGEDNFMHQLIQYGKW